MSYLILECATSYAVALDDEGRFMKVPNLGYKMGQEVDDVITFEGSPFGEADVVPFEARRARRTRGRRVALVAAAACLAVAVVAGAAVWQLPVGTVYMSINPEVSIEVNRLDRVVGLDGENDDGDDLIEGFAYYGRTLDEVSDDLADLAEDQGYLDDGGTIELTVESDDEEWRTATEDRLIVELEVHLDHRVAVTGAAGGEDVAPAPQVEQVTTPEPPTEVTAPPAFDDDGWGEADDGDDDDDDDDDEDEWDDDDADDEDDD
ncbi:MAG: hypothetical protein Q4B91_07370 [Atopobiaceae bacterium]|nr:hypothetical protein [Atopobiaceae bacterium]